MEPGGALDELAERYSAELKTHHHHVLEALRFQAEMAATLYDKEPRAPEVSSSASHSSCTQLVQALSWVQAPCWVHVC